MAQSLLDTGKALLAQARYPEALTLFRQAVETAPKDAEALFLLGSMLRDTGEHEAGLKLLQRALHAAGGQNDAIAYNIGLTQLLLGDTQGYAGYAKRRQVLPLAPPAALTDLPAWRGEANKNAHLCIWPEQGIGDVIMAAALIPQLLERTSRVTWQVDARLMKLLTRSFPFVTFQTPEQPVDGATHQCPVMDLFPLLCPSLKRTSPAPYLKVDETRRETFRQQLAALPPGRKLGMSWFSITQPAGRLRSIPLPAWQTLLASKGITPVSIQYGNAAAAIEAFNRETGAKLQLLPGLNSWQDIDGLAALISALDEVISIDNSCVHLAGAVGAPCTVLLPITPDWRWGLSSATSFWYGSMHLLRQKAFGNWDDVLYAAQQALINRI